MDRGMQKGLTSRAPGGERTGREGTERIYSMIEKREGAHRALEMRKKELQSWTPSPESEVLA